MTAEDLALLPPAATALIAQLREQLAQRDREIAVRDARLEKLQLELARLKRWKYGAKTEAMSAEQRSLFEDTLAEDEAALRAQLAALQAAMPEKAESGRRAPQRPRREALPAHLRRVEHRHEPEDTTCGCGRAMQRIGEDVSERLDVVPAEFFVHRHVHGK